MLHWSFNEGTEKDLKIIAEHSYEIAKQYNLNWIAFVLYGFNRVEVRIVKIKQDEYEVLLVDEGDYDIHGLDKEGYSDYVKNREERLAKRINKSLHWKLQTKSIQSLLPVVMDVTEIFVLKRKNELGIVSFSLDQKQIEVDYLDDKGFEIAENESQDL